jgi:hypothetical protein
MDYGVVGYLVLPLWVSFLGKMLGVFGMDGDEL